MAVETVTNYTCDRCSRSEIKDGVTILTLTVRKRAGKNVPGQGVSEFTRHVCAENCLKMIKASMAPVGIAGQYDRTAAAQRRKAAREAASTAPVPETTPEITPEPSVAVAVPVIKINKKATSTTTKGGTKNAQKPVSRTLTAVPDTTPEDTRADVVRAVRAITRKPNGGWAKGYNHASERKMIAERESLARHPSGRDL